MNKSIKFSTYTIEGIKPLDGHIQWKLSSILIEGKMC